MLLFLLLVASVVAGFTSGDFYEKWYGETISLRLRTNTLSLMFMPTDNSESVIFWKHDDPSVPVDRRRSVSGGYLEIKNLTQKDNGRYKMIGKNDKFLSSHSLEVRAKYEKLELEGGEQLRFTFPLVKDHCNIYFFPTNHDYELTKFDTELVRSGTKVLTQSYCTGFEFVKPCGLEMEMQELCAGLFEVRDQSHGVALKVEVDWMGEPFNLGHIGTSVGAFLVSLFCCCCVKRCCCKSSKKKDADSAATEVAVAHNQYDNEPVALRPGQPSPRSQTYYPPQPSYAPTGPLIHNPTIVNVPPAFSEVSAPAEPANAPTFSLLSDSGLRFELVGKNFPSAPPLSSESTYDSVYTSNKLDFP